MENNFNKKGQVLYVDPFWVSGDTCLFAVTNPIQKVQAKAKLSKIRKDFILRLEKEGFIITYNKNDIDENTISLTMDDTAIVDGDKDIQTYKKSFDKRMFEAGGDKLNYPYTLTMEKYLENPFLPAVLKNELVNGGTDKFLITTPNQVSIIKRFYEKYKDNLEMKDVLNCSIFQQLIETPTKYHTYIRVLMSASGDVMGASLKYSNCEYKKENAKGVLEKYFLDEKSEYYLDAKKMFNYYSGGGNISFNQPKYSTEKQEILKAHGINPVTPVIPSDILEVASSMVSKCNRELGVICGIDFILNEQDNKWYYLENQAFPAIDEWAITKGIRVNSINSIDDYIKYLAIELEARYDALMLCMNKKLSQKQEEKVLVLK